jgi:hypothetical protein
MTISCDRRWAGGSTGVRPDDLTLLSDLQFVLARILWAPYCDRERAVALAELAAKSHPDPERRAAIAAWLTLRLTPAIDDIAISDLRRSLRHATS